MTKPRLVLASTSPHRRRQLERLGLRFECVAPDCDETAAKALGFTPRELAVHLARAKATSVASPILAAGGYVLGGDQVCALGDEVFDKPGDAATAVAHLRRLAGRTHALHTAICVLGPDGFAADHVDTTRLTMRDLPSRRLERYVAADEPLDCAGSYRLERRGVALFERIESADQSAVEGIPLLALSAILDELGFDVP